MSEHAAPSAIAPAGADLRVVARVRMVTPGRGVASMRVAMRVTVTERDEDERSLARAIGQAMRTLALVALLLAALAAGTQAHGRGGEVVPFGGDGRAHATVVAAADSSPGDTAGDVQAVESSTAPLLAVLAAAPSSPMRAQSHRMPRPALVAGVIPSPD